MLHCLHRSKDGFYNVGSAVCILDVSLSFILLFDSIHCSCFFFQLLVFLYIELERRKGFITSGVLFVYWVLACLTFIIPFYTEIIKEVSLPDKQEVRSELLNHKKSKYTQGPKVIPQNVIHIYYSNAFMFIYLHFLFESLNEPLHLLCG